MVHLDVQREATTFETLDEFAFPRWPRQIQRLAVQAGDQLSKLAFTTGLGQCRQPHVVFEINVGFLFPHRTQALEAGAAQAMIPR